MSDWELVQDNPEQISQTQSGQSDWEIVQPEPNSMQPQSNESLGMAALKAIPRIGEDLYRGGMGFIKNIPGYMQSAKTEVPGIFAAPVLNALQGHKGRASAQAMAGVTELGHNLLNFPRGIADYTSNRLNLLPKSVAEKVPYQKDISGDINQFFGEPDYAGGSLIRGAARNALNLMGAGKVASTLNPMNLTVKNIAKDVLNTADSNKKIYGNLYDHLWDEADKKGFNNALNDINIDMKTLKKFSPKKSIQAVVDFDNNPTLQNAHKAKSDLLRIQRDLNKLSTLRGAERQQLKAASDAIDSIQGNMFKNAAGELDQNMLNKYAKIQQGYASEVIPYKNKAINKFKRNEISAKELVNSLSKGEFAAKRGKHHPEIGFRNTFKDHPYITGAVGVAGLTGIGKMIYDNMFGNQPTE